MHVREAGATDTSGLVARAKAGDRTAFDALVESYAPRIYNIALRITGSRDEAQDCVQDAFIRAFSALRHFREEAAFSTWLYRVAVNVANDACRRLKSQPVLASELAGPGSDDPFDRLRAGPFDRLPSTSLRAGRAGPAPDIATPGRGAWPNAPTARADPDPDEQLARAQRRELVLTAIRSLPEHHRAVIVLCDLQGLSYQEVAEVIGMRVGTVKSRLNRARLALKERLEPHLELLRG
jgi:RNA polymerase sigma-70 factor (ECF subfamily)